MSAGGRWCLPRESLPSEGCLPRGVSAQGRVSGRSPCGQMTDACKNITLLHCYIADGKNDQ